MDLGLAQRTYVVSGGTRGLGRATAEALVADDARVVVSSRSATNVEEAVAALGVDRAVGAAADNADPETADRLVAMAIERFGALHGALISVGGPPGGDLASITDHQWRTAFDTVFLGALRLARATAEAIEATSAEGGSIVFVLSTTSRQANAHLAISNGLRPGLAMVRKTLADELGPKGIRVNGLLPGRVDTDRVRELDALVGDPAEVQRHSAAAIPVGRYGRPEEFGQTAAFLLSPAAGYINGTMLAVDGGMTRTW